MNSQSLIGELKREISTVLSAFNTDAENFCDFREKFGGTKKDQDLYNHYSDNV